eukprot:CAMPEP_0174346354 /NCGR_PEP_ID=MMETSP0811_2-20130205/2042_1 /TAXON_ID=73025 ORGANISM="Eutreptiella gymnastica-like, Strain CCMP1594" /NCGR_SAMPLE_ID=MMETSP0811_2 /ASSEMBLY_ACC=CAM_ASM_000667 /LENGTH=57 /DNA_ID=CAMNT_0015470845 /DNA_START=39 /DNA_END=210 /DNA_ORIENTATION=+
MADVATPGTTDGGTPTALTTSGKSWEDDEVQIVWAVGYGALAISKACPLRASFTSPK